MGSSLVVGYLSPMESRDPKGLGGLVDLLSVLCCLFVASVSELFLPAGQAGLLPLEYGANKKSGLRFLLSVTCPQRSWWICCPLSVVGCLITHKLIHSQTHKLTNSPTHQLISTPSVNLQMFELTYFTSSAISVLA